MSKASCPACGAELDVVLSVAEPEPEPVPKTQFWPSGWGPFEFGVGMEGWLNGQGTASIRYQTLGYHNRKEDGRGWPAIVHLGPTKDPDDKVKYLLKLKHDDANTFGIHIWDERPWDAKAQQWLDYVRENMPRWKVFSGPFGWTVLFKPDHYRHLDGVISYQNCTRRTRTPYDWLRHVMFGEYYGRPVVFSLNPLDSDTPPVLSNAGRYDTAMRGAAKAFAGILVWGSDVLCNLDSGVDLHCPNAGELPGILDTLDQVKRWQEGATYWWREPLKIKVCETPAAWPVRIDEKLMVAAGRVVYFTTTHRPVIGVGEGIDPFDYPGVPVPENYLAARRACNDWPYWTAEREEFMLKCEQAMGEALAAQIGG